MACSVAEKVPKPTIYYASKNKITSLDYQMLHELCSLLERLDALTGGKEAARDVLHDFDAGSVTDAIANEVICGYVVAKDWEQVVIDRLYFRQVVTIVD